jgi:hypothetical protein
MSEELTTEEYFAIENAESIYNIPAEQFPDREACLELIWRAFKRQDVRAYTPATSDEYVIWDRRPDPATESRFKPMDWAALWRAGKQPEYLGDETD